MAPTDWVGRTSDRSILRSGFFRRRRSNLFFRKISSIRFPLISARLRVAAA
ncbi:PH domain-containing protein [Burkholderia ambifaria]|nr:PH domain-containing protein [Burkholderia ambifaria]